MQIKYKYFFCTVFEILSKNVLENYFKYFSNTFKYYFSYSKNLRREMNSRH